MTEERTRSVGSCAAIGPVALVTNNKKRLRIRHGIICKHTLSTNLKNGGQNLEVGSEFYHEIKFSTFKSSFRHLKLISDVSRDV